MRSTTRRPTRRISSSVQEVGIDALREAVGDGLEAVPPTIELRKSASYAYLEANSHADPCMFCELYDLTVPSLRDPMPIQALGCSHTLHRFGHARLLAMNRGSAFGRAASVRPAWYDRGFRGFDVDAQ